MNEDYRHLIEPSLSELDAQCNTLQSLYSDIKKGIVIIFYPKYKDLLSQKIDNAIIKTTHHNFSENLFWIHTYHTMNAHRVALIDMIKDMILDNSDSSFYCLRQDLHNFFDTYFRFDKESYFFSHYNTGNYIDYLYALSSETDGGAFKKEFFDICTEYSSLLNDDIYDAIYKMICDYIYTIVAPEIELRQRRILFDRSRISYYITTLIQTIRDKKREMSN